ncbi:MAG: type II CAAX endopeptidase family protein [Desulfobacteraceae bacterium]|nr:type II CAAX endopeptidase family protein [Desulfobacteraceae bacterium]
MELRTIAKDFPPEEDLIKTIEPIPYPLTADDGANRFGPAVDQPSRKVQTVELVVFLLLVLPALSTSFLIDDQSGGGFILSAVYSILGDLGLLSLVFYFLWRNGEPLRRLGWTLGKLPKEIGWGLVLFLPVIYGANKLESALHSLGLSAPSKVPSFLAAKGFAGIAVAVVMVVVVAVVEEIIYRGYLILRLKSVARRSWAAVLLSSAIFCLGHGYEGLAGVISIYFLGVALALIYVWRGSLVAPMIIHFMIDFSSIVLAAMLGGRT